jgi:predicted nucleic acid-binding protein
MILVDANIFMYAAGAEHPFKEPSREFLEQVARGEVEAAVDAEVLQELLHRYRASEHWAEGGRIYDLARQIVPLVIPITAELLDKSRALLDRYIALTARDALHAAVVLSHGLQAICSYDRDFDEIESLKRLQPQ